jgi:hypothetical protein
MDEKREDVEDKMIELRWRSDDDPDDVAQADMKTRAIERGPWEVQVHEDINAVQLDVYGEPGLVVSVGMGVLDAMKIAKSILEAVESVKADSTKEEPLLPPVVMGPGE